MMGKEIKQSLFERIKIIEKELKATNKKIKKLGFTVYLSAGTVNIMKGPSHDDSPRCNAIHENSVHSFHLEGWDGGDW